MPKSRGIRKNQKNRMVSAESTHLKTLAPIPKDIVDPVEWASKHLESLIPQSAKELEWVLKFGDAKSRKEVALELLSFKGIAKKNENTNQVVPAIQLIMNSPLPWSQVTVATEKPKELVEGTIIKDPESNNG